jgi:aspartyl protease family protein
MLDTGATNVAVPEALAQKIGLRRGPSQQILTANGIATAYATEIQSLHIGSIELNNVKASVTPSMQGESILLGMSALKRIDFSQSGDLLTLTQSK